MRTTLNIDDDVAQILAERSRSDGRSMSRVANDLMRAGLSAGHGDGALPAYDPPVFDSGMVMIDITDIAEALDRLDERG